MKRMAIHDKHQREFRKKLRAIDILKQGDVFGEIAMFSSLKRTCTVIANSYMMV